ncbi:energy-coupling factor transporter transmembrane component T [Paenibacillus hexagrammi]|uniref:Energy-coupling factor transporter transmembrane protein EcfT n=1 Tax=Paenibacillus hexagrammi TaxID=2908839 RepID=A0ABY3SF43_9BACL|nr:energy-coupling factor transporter transmembrane component T [Paenibacillus sp. YPD9-1]UJF32613.1 energy-coupling factor transporter transmembrane protein EcfT [Paenibacillus sp. YPD9-1]
MKSGFRSFHPFVCFFYYIGAMLLGMLVTHPVYLLTLLMTGVLLTMLNRESRALLSMLKFYLPISLLYALLNPLFSHRGRHILFYFWDQPVTLESLAYGGYSTVNLLNILVLFISFNAVLPPSRFLYIFGSYFPKIGLLVVMSMRFVPLLKRRLTDIASVQRMKGINIAHGSLRKRMTDGMKLLQILLTLSLEEALQTADAMKAKGYGSGTRSRYEAYALMPRDIRLLGLLSVLFISSIVFHMLGYGEYKIFPSLGEVSIQEWNCWHTGALRYLLQCRSS